MGILDSMVQFGSDLLTNGINWFSQQQTNEMNERLMRESWARDDTAMQRKVADLEAAGLNPVLAAGGSGAPNSGPIRIGAPQLSGIDMGRVFGAQTAHAQADIGQANLGAAQAAESVAKTQADILRKQYMFADPNLPQGMSPLVMYPVLKQQSEANKAMWDSMKASEDAKAAESLKLSAEQDLIAKQRLNRLGDKYGEAQVIAGLAGEGIGAALQGLKGAALLAK